MRIDTVDSISRIVSGQKSGVPVAEKEPQNNSAAPVEQQTAPLQVSEREVIRAIEQANKTMINHNTRAEFSVHEVTKDIMIKIIDTDSNQVIREIPPKKILDLIAKLCELAGIMVDERR